MAHDHGIFLDHAASTPVHPQVLGLMLPFFGNHFAPPSSPFSAGGKPRAALEQARQCVAGLIGAGASEIVFTATGTEANNLALLGVAQGRRGHAVVSGFEHASVLHAMEHLQSAGMELTVLGAGPGGMVDPAEVSDALRDDTVMISVMHACNETGVIQPVEEIGRMARERGITFHCDCVASAGKIPVDAAALHADLISLSSHKLYGPKGAGALYVRSGTRISPVLFGSAQERGLRPGALNMPAIVGFGRACEEARSALVSNADHTRGLRDLLEREISSRIPGVTINGAGCCRVPHISSISFSGIQADNLAAWLDLHDITVSGRGSRLSSVSPRRLEALGIAQDLAPGTVRFSPGWENTEDEMREVAHAVEKAVSGLREFALQLRDAPVCIMALLSRNHVERACAYLSGEGIPCAVTARPEGLSHLPGPEAAIAVPYAHRQDVERILGSHRVTAAGRHCLSRWGHRP
ncbi:MAG TPA: cysteine desulfurase family protein [Deltaproteobacteria bacterium]|nr:cysteine desulfurase family protein [Deltaproteobacteria bacterium]